MAKLLTLLALLFGGLCCLIGLAHILFGPSVIPGSIPGTVTMDNEDRFYATIFLGYGVAMIWAARDLAARRGTFFALVALFFVAGLSRLISVAMVGWPVPSITAFLIFELILPPLFWWMHRRAYPG